MRKAKGLNVMELGVLVVFFLGLMAWLAIEKDSQDSEAEITWTTEKDIRTGEIFDVETIRCHICKQVISYVRINGRGKAVGGFARSTHDCNRFLAKNPHSALGVGAKDFDFWKWLANWQKKLSRISQ